MLTLMTPSFVLPVPRRREQFVGVRVETAAMRETVVVADNGAPCFTTPGPLVSSQVGRPCSGTACRRSRGPLNERTMSA